MNNLYVNSSVHDEKTQSEEEEDEGRVAVKCVTCKGH